MSGLDIAKKSARGSVVLFAGNIIAQIVGAVTIFLIARMLGPANYGVYNLALLLPGLFQLFIGIGVPSSVIRYSAYSISQGKMEEARRVTINAIYFIWMTGFAFTALCYVLAGPLAPILLHRNDLTTYVQLASLAIAGNAILNTISFTAIGWGWMSLSAMSTVAQSLVKLVLAPVLILLGFSVVGALTGHIISLFAGGLIGTGVLYFNSLRSSTHAGGFFADIRKMLGFGLPLYIGVVGVGLAGYYVSVTLAGIADNTVYGLYQAALNFLLPASLVTTSLTNALFPAFASVDGTSGDSRIAFKKAYKFHAFLILPTLFFLTSCAALLTREFYGAAYAGSTPYLEYLSLAYLPIAFGYTVHPAFFSGFGRPRFTLAVYASNAGVLVASVFLLTNVLGFGIYGLIAATFLGYFSAWAIGTILAGRYMGATLDFKAHGAMLLAGVVSFLVTAFLPHIPFSKTLTLGVDFFVFFGLYLTVSPLVRAIDKDDLAIMDHTFSDARLIGPLFKVLLRYERRLLSLGPWAS